MANKVFDRVQEFVTTKGTGAHVLSGVTPGGFRSYASVLSNNDTFDYCCLDPASGAWEVATGTFNQTPNTITRTTILANSLGTTAPINYGGNQGTYIFLAMSANMILSLLNGSATALPDGTTLVKNSDGTLSVKGRTVESLDNFSTIDSTAVAAALLVLRTAATQSKVATDYNMTMAQQLAWFLANDNSVSLDTATALSTIPSDFEVVGISAGKHAVVLWSTLKADLASSSGNTSSGAAISYVISTSSMGTVGTAQPVNVVSNGNLANPVTITLADGAGGTFGGTVLLPAGNNTMGTTQYTPSGSAGTRTITGTNNGNLTNPAGANVTVAAATAPVSYPAFSFVEVDSYTTGKFGQALKTGKGATSKLTLVANGAAGTAGQADLVLNAHVRFGTSSPGSYRDFLLIQYGGMNVGWRDSNTLDTNNGDGGATHTFANVYDDNDHYLRLVLLTANGATHAYWFVDGNQVADKVLGGPLLTSSTVTVFVDAVAAGKYVDEIEVLNTSVGMPSGAAVATRTSASNVIYHFDGSAVGA